MPQPANRFKILLDAVQKTDPSNWKNITPTTERHPRYRSLLTTFSEGVVELVKDAKTYVDGVYALYGTSKSISLTLQEWDNATQAYVSINSLGRLNLSKKYKRKRSKTEVGFEPSDFVMNLLNRDEIELNLQELTDLDDNAITTFTNEYETVSVSPEATLLTAAVNSFKQSANLNQATVTDRYLELGFDSYTENGFSYPEFSPAFEINEPSVDNQIDTSEIVNLRAILTYNIEVAFRLVDLGSLTYSHTITISLVRKITRNAGGSETETIATVTETTSGSGNYNFVRTLSGTFDEDLALLANDKVKYYIFFDIESSTLNENADYYYEMDPTTLTLSLSDLPSTVAATDCRVMLPWEFFLRMGQKITGRNDCLRSPVFGRTDGEVYNSASDGELAFMAITSVKQVRGFPIAANPIQCSFQKGFEIYDKMFMLGLGVTYESGVPYLYIDKYEDMLDNETTPVLSFTAIENEIEWEAAIQYIWGSVKCGFRNFSSDGASIQQSPHSERQYTVPFLSEFSSEEYDIVNDVIASSHLIEDLRLNYAYADDPYKDSDFDDDLVILSLKRDGAGGYELRHKDDFSSVTGIVEVGNNPAPYYNIDLTPARLVRNHSRLIYAGLAKRLVNFSFSEFLRYQSGNGNRSVTTTKTGEGYTINENNDIPRSSLPTAGQGELFDASEMGSCTVLVTKSDRQAISEAIFIAVQVTDSTGTYTGFIESFKEVDLGKGIAKLKFLNSTSAPPRAIITEQGQTIDTEDGLYFELEG